MYEACKELKLTAGKTAYFGAIIEDDWSFTKIQFQFSLKLKKKVCKNAGGLKIDNSK